MDEDGFWAIIEAARADGDAEARDLDEAVAPALVARLAATSTEEILDFEEQFYRVRDAIYRWDVWAAAYLIGGGCSEDSFAYFLAGVIALGRDWYERVRADPDALADHPLVRLAAADEDDRELFAEAVDSATVTAYERLTGDVHMFFEAWRARLEAVRRDGGTDDMGEDFDFDDEDEMRRRLPRLMELFAIDG